MQLQNITLEDEWSNWQLYEWAKFNSQAGRSMDVSQIPSPFCGALCSQILPLGPSVHFCISACMWAFLGSASKWMIMTKQSLDWSCQREAWGGLVSGQEIFCLVFPHPCWWVVVISRIPSWPPPIIRTWVPDIQAANPETGHTPMLNELAQSECFLGDWF